MKKILIAGKGSYIGRKIEECLNRYAEDYLVQSVDTKSGEYAAYDFGEYDTVIDVAGIAHIQIKPEMEQLFYQVNRDLAIELCQKTKAEGCKQFIYMSSMNVFGDTDQEICGREQENPKNFYGKSKLEADLAIHRLSDEQFKVVSVRPPVVYGLGCKGNFNKLIKLSKISPFYPTYKNIRSMIYIENLCEYIRGIVDNELDGYFHPQNASYVSTGECIRVIRKNLGKKSFGVSIFNPFIKFLLNKNHTIERAFSNDFYSMDISDLQDERLSRCYIVDFEETIKRTLKE